MAAEQPLDPLAPGPLWTGPAATNFSFSVSRFPPRSNLGFAAVGADSPVDFQYSVDPNRFGSFTPESDDPDPEYGHFALIIPCLSKTLAGGGPGGVGVVILPRRAAYRASSIHLYFRYSKIYGLRINWHKQCFLP